MNWIEFLTCIHVRSTLFIIRVPCFGDIANFYFWLISGIVTLDLVFGAVSQLIFCPMSPLTVCLFTWNLSHKILYSFFMEFLFLCSRIQCFLSSWSLLTYSCNTKQTQTLIGRVNWHHFLVNHLQTAHNRWVKNHKWRWDMGYLLWVWRLPHAVSLSLLYHIHW